VFLLLRIRPGEGHSAPISRPISPILRRSYSRGSVALNRRSPGEFGLYISFIFTSAIAFTLFHQGLLVRMPLRKSVSALSDKVVSERDTKIFLKKFKQQVEGALLFSLNALRVRDAAQS